MITETNCPENLVVLTVDRLDDITALRPMIEGALSVGHTVNVFKKQGADTCLICRIKPGHGSYFVSRGSKGAEKVRSIAVAARAGLSAFDMAFEPSAIYSGNRL